MGFPYGRIITVSTLLEILHGELLLPDGRRVRCVSTLLEILPLMSGGFLGF